MPTATIFMHNDGGWCWITAAYTVMGGVPSLPDRNLAIAPEHGVVKLDVFDKVAKRVRYAYRPEQGFVGTDHFTVAVNMVGGSFEMPFTVTVTEKD
jgi:hypothetical protein